MFRRSNRITNVARLLYTETPRRYGRFIIFLASLAMEAGDFVTHYI